MGVVIAVVVAAVVDDPGKRLHVDSHLSQIERPRIPPSFTQIYRDRRESELCEVRQQDLLDVVEARGRPRVRATDDTHADRVPCPGEKVGVDCLEDEKGCSVGFLRDSDLL